MPIIYDNIEQKLGQGLAGTLVSACRADFCVGYLNLRGWKLLARHIEHFEGGENCCRLLAGMQHPGEEIIKQAYYPVEQGMMDNPTALALKKEMARAFRRQLTYGLPTAEDEAALRKLKQQLEQQKVKVKLFLRHLLHAKLYLLHRRDRAAQLVGFVGSSNLTLSGLSLQGELNVDVLEQDAARKLAAWFEERWNDRWCIDITQELAEIIQESWAGDKLIPPYHVYLKIAWHLSQEARTGMNNYTLPAVLQKELLAHQANAVAIAARHLEKRNGVLIGDVVGLGKTLTAIAVAKLSEETFFTDTLILCPKNLKSMWEEYVQRYQLRARVHSISAMGNDFAEKTHGYRIVIIDESHNLRNRQGKKYAQVKEYLQKNESKVILLTATPYNKSYTDISSQFRLFIPEDRDLGISPERFIAECGGPHRFTARYQCAPNTLAAFEKSPYAEDWQELLKLYMVRRTRTFIKENYALWDEVRRQHFLLFCNGEKSYFPRREARRAEYSFSEADETDLYVKLYSDAVVARINSLHLARYGLGNFIEENKVSRATREEKKILDNLSRAGRRLMGFCRTNLFKRLESSGFSFLVSIARQALRNEVFVYAIENDLPLPIGAQEALPADEFIEEQEDGNEQPELTFITGAYEMRIAAAAQYKNLRASGKRFGWVSPALFKKKLLYDLKDDTEVLLEILETGKKWDAGTDKKLNALVQLCTEQHPEQKVLVFTQFADTAHYLVQQLQRRQLKGIACVTGGIDDPTALIRRFSPRSNGIKDAGEELRILICTDVLSEGQNLQDSHIIVNYDLPWALIRLIQRAGRVDRIGQASSNIICYSFLPQDGLERIIGLRSRLTQRITQNAEVVGTDETFFDGDPVNLSDLYSEKSAILEDDEGEVDLASQAWEIWNRAVKADPSLKKIIPSLPDVIYSTRPSGPEVTADGSVITYHRNSNNYEVLSWLNKEGKIISHSHTRILKAAACTPRTPALPRLAGHHHLAALAVEQAEKEAGSTGGQLGSPFGARHRTYRLLQRYYESVKGTLSDTAALKKTIDDLYHYPLRETARGLLNRRLKTGIAGEELAALCIQLREEGKLNIIEESDRETTGVPRIICSMGIKSEGT